MSVSHDNGRRIFANHHVAAAVTQAKDVASLVGEMVQGCVKLRLDVASVDVVVGVK